MRVVVIGATGHIGTYLVPRLLKLGHEVVAVSRGNREPYQGFEQWKGVELLHLDRVAEEKKGAFGKAIAALEPEAVIDLLLFHPSSLPQILDSLSGRIKHYLYCGTMWIYGPTEKAPTTEEEPRRAEDDYGQEKAEIEARLLEQARKGKFPATALHPGHIVGPGWPPIVPAGNLNLEIFEKLGRGEEVCLPDHGLATLHHVHADDVAQAFGLALEKPAAAIGENFNVVSPQALTLRGFCREVAAWFGAEASLSYLDWNQWKETVSEYEAEVTWEHIRNCPCGSIEKARRLLGYNPRYSSLEAVHESLDWLIRQGKVRLPSLTRV